MAIVRTCMSPCSAVTGHASKTTLLAKDTEASSAVGWLEASELLTTTLAFGMSCEQSKDGIFTEWDVHFDLCSASYAA